MENEDNRTVWCGNLSDSMTEELLFELFLQAAPLERVRIPQDRGGRKSNYAFIVFKHSQSVPYVVNLLHGISMFDKKLNIKPRCKNQLNDVQFTQTSIKNRLGKRVNEEIQNDAVLPVMIPPFENIGNLHFQNLLQLGQMMNVVSMQNSYMSSFQSRQNSQRNSRNIRDYRREDNKPYDRHDRYGRNNIHSYENQRRHRRY